MQGNDVLPHIQRNVTSEMNIILLKEVSDDEIKNTIS